MQQQSKKGGFIRFLVSRAFWSNLLLAAAILIVLFVGLLEFLKAYTRHGEEYVLPDFKGVRLAIVDSLGYTDRYDFMVIDSVYSDELPPGTIVLQEPQPGTRVKKGRNIYLTVVASTPEMVIMPDLQYLTLRQAINVLKINKLQTGKLIYHPSFDKNAVLAQMYMGDTIHPGDTLVKGSAIDLVIGSGDMSKPVPVPFLIGKTREEAIYDLNVASFNLGREFFLDSIMDEHQRVYMQEPRWDADFPSYPGDSIHLWYRSDTAVDFYMYKLQFLPDSLWPDSLRNDTNLINLQIQ
ncbi:MAG: hypothetical protein Kow00127_00330 [Bacteroidales bacterium]